MVVVQWVGIVIAALGLAWSGYREYPVMKREYQRMNTRQAVGVEANRFRYTTLHIAYDVVLDKHWFLHADGVWRDYVPRPN